MSYPGGGYQGLGAFQEPRGRGPVIAAVVAAVVLGGGAATFLVLDRAPAAGGPAPAPPPTTAATTPGGELVDNLTGRIAFTVPVDWDVADGADPVVLKSLGTPITSYATAGAYECAGESYNRGFAGSGVARPGEINQVATDIAHAVGVDGYSSASSVRVEVGTPKPVTRSRADGAGVDGVRVEAVVTTSGNACMSTRGLIAVTVLDLGGRLGFVVANGDVEGGPADPAVLDGAAVAAIADSARPS
ncbi:hypothetical protein [Actinokineospora pegani]|uniref:hypothetical protein n=1 Tax=Actinokineospora pegani TaxID=2654637 RepID=UPI0012EAC566|nr:hypothetical protein [Actinokineospora pegani]